MGTPEKPDEYVAIQVGEWARRYGKIYIPLEMWQALRPASQEFLFYIEGHGRYQIAFDVPVGRLEV